MIPNLCELVHQYRDVNYVQETTKLTKNIHPILDSCQLDDLYVFGDSLCDIGNAFDVTKKAMDEGRPPSPPYFQGRFSNGPVWVEYLALLLGLTSKRSHNFAVGGANTGSNNTFIPNNPLGLPGLQQQIDTFTTTLKTKNQSANPRALYIIWAGANDYLGAGVTNPTMPIENLSKAVVGLAAVGAKNIMVVNLPDLGKLPATNKNIEQSIALNTLSQAHNSGLASSLKTLRKSFKTSINIILYDINSLFNQVLEEPTKFGFTNVIDAELDKLAQVQLSTDQFFFWDVIHPTTTTHIILAKSVIPLLSLLMV
ncbi:MAG: SGNH/GDSL hydrolase family protein [Scytonema sp. PMC 1069.18]|nr:SGNH/GDSL hydrolase family protein [Scytonema sp. PMC 1069.18]MEC4886342.1 SGNH/GDSL hydrolase family protein [Scytonema sp. PMC 1070.18]